MQNRAAEPVVCLFLTIGTLITYAQSIDYLISVLLDSLARPTFGEPIASSERQFDVCVQHQRRRGLRVLPTRTNLF